MSTQALLKKGDIIKLEKGMRVYTTIPTKFLNPAVPLSTEYTHSDISIGDILHRKLVPKNYLEEKIKRLFENEGISLKNDIKIPELVNSLNINTSAEIFDTSYLEGEYIVKNTREDGGNYQHPHGHHVFCRKLNSGVDVDFYQTGSFTAMIENITPISTP